MPTIISHPAIALVYPRAPLRVLIAGALLSILPDADVVAFALDIPYSHPFGHRGFSHSLVFALLTATLASLALHGRARVFLFLFLCAVSHPVLDAMTTGGLGIAFFAPFDNERYFLPWRPIRVSPIGPRFFSGRGLAVLMSEVVWVWLPCVAAGLLGKYVFDRKSEAGK